MEQMPAQDPYAAHSSTQFLAAKIPRSLKDASTAPKEVAHTPDPILTTVKPNGNTPVQNLHQPMHLQKVRMLVGLLCRFSLFLLLCIMEVFEKKDIV